MQTEKNKKRFGLLGLVLAIIAMGLLTWFVGKPMLSFLRDTERFRAWVSENGWKSRFVFSLMCCVQVILAVIPGGPMEVAAGYAFGPVEGVTLSLVGIVLGSMIVFFAVRIAGVRLVRLFFTQDKIDSMLCFKNPKRAFLIISVIMIFPGTPKDLITYCMGLTGISAIQWLLISTIARIPAIFTSVLCGNAIANRQYGTAIIVFCILALFCGIGLYLFSGKENL